MKRYPKRLPPFPWLDLDERFRFPDPMESPDHGLCGIGGNLSLGMLISAYEQGLFPWYGDDEPIMWWSPDPRFVLFPEELRVSSSMRRVLNSGRFRITADTAFPRVIRYCSKVSRKGQNGTWITEEMIEAYVRLHEAGYAHSVEAWMDENLAGGFYGIALGAGFFGESMFSLEPNASKAAFITFCRLVTRQPESDISGIADAVDNAGIDAIPRFDFIDCQVHSTHIESLGARLIERPVFLELLEQVIRQPGAPGKWSMPG